MHPTTPKGLSSVRKALRASYWIKSINSTRNLAQFDVGSRRNMKGHGIRTTCGVDALMAPVGVEPTTSPTDISGVALPVALRGLRSNFRNTFAINQVRLGDEHATTNFVADEFVEEQEFLDA